MLIILLIILEIELVAFDCLLTSLLQIYVLRLEHWPLWSTAIDSSLLNSLPCFIDKTKPFIFPSKNLGQNLERSQHASLYFVCNWDSLSVQTLLLAIEDLKREDIAVGRSFLLCICSHVLSEFPVKGIAVVLEDLQRFVSLEDDVISSSLSYCAASNSYILIALSTGSRYFKVLILSLLARCANIFISWERFILWRFLIVEQIFVNVWRYLEQSDFGR